MGDPGSQKGSSSYASHPRTPTARSVQQTRLLALESGLALFLEGANALLVVLAVVHHPPQSLDPLKPLWRHRVRTGENAQLLLHDRNAQRGIRRDLVRQTQRERLQIRSGHDVVDHPVSLSASRIDRLGREVISLAMRRPVAFRKVSIPPTLYGTPSLA